MPCRAGIAAGSPITVVFQLEGLSGELRLDHEDLTPVARRSTGFTDNDSTRLPGGYGQWAHQGGYDVKSAVAFTQFATSVDTDAAGLVENTFCILSSNAQDCDREEYRHDIRPVGNEEAMVTFATWELPAGEYDVHTTLEVQNTVTELSWSTAWSGIFLEY